MIQKMPVVFAWSGGKDSAYALYQLMRDERYDVRYLLSTINGTNRRLSMHGVREELIEAQAGSIGIPLLKAYMYEGNNSEYERQMETMLLKVKAMGIHHIAFGDIFLEDLRAYREEKMSTIGMYCLFPLWKKDTVLLARDFISKGFKTFTCCVQDDYLDERWCGRLIDENFLNKLPSAVDPCGENGEFHSFCFEGPLFKKALPISAGRKLYKPLEIKTSSGRAAEEIKAKGFWYCEMEMGADDL